MKNKKVLLIVILGILGVTGWFAYQMFFNKSTSMGDFARNNSQSGKTSSPTGVVYQKAISDNSKQQAFYCPEPEDLVLSEAPDGMKWVSKNGKWQTYTPTSATKILGFIGAQWQGIKVGNIICLYQTNEAVPFPAALEQKLSKLVLEPKNIGGWSAPVDGRRLCKSTNVADCVYYVQAPENVKDIYEQIQYAPDVSSYTF